jgi:hypothetical protein
MRIRSLGTAAGILCWGLALGLAGCRPAQQIAPGEVTADPPYGDLAIEAHEVAEASLGKQAIVLAHGNLALNGREQVLAVNSLSRSGATGQGESAGTPIPVTRAAILEKNGGKWSQVLLCDEHLKNPDGYLGGSPVPRVTGWQLEYRQDTKQGLEMRLTPAGVVNAAEANSGQTYEQRFRTLDVRWNKSAKRYQTYDQSHERFLSEVPSLDIPQSILK